MEEQKIETPIQENSTLNMVSYGFGKFVAEFFTFAFTAYCFFFYETELGLDSILVGLGFVIYALWNAVNDPLVGYLTDKSLKIFPKFGKRFAWIVIGAFPWVFIYVLIFSPPIIEGPQRNLVLFLWLTLTSCLFDTFYSLWDVHYQALFPEKFLHPHERRKAAGVGTVVGVFGIALGSMLPPLLIVSGQLESYVRQGWILAFVGLAAISAMLPGMKDSEAMVERNGQSSLAEAVGEEESFMELFKYTIKHPNLISFMVLYMFYQALTQSMTGSVPYFTEFILQEPQTFVTIAMAGFLVGALVSIPIWIKLAQKTGDNRKLIIIGSCMLIVLSLPFMFVESLLAVQIVLVLYGVGLGLFWAMTGPVFADVIDEVVVEKKIRNEGVYMGFRALFGRLAYAIQGITFAVVHILTGFVEVADTQTPLAQFGIRLHMSLIPVILLVFGTIYFVKKNDLRPEKVKRINEKLVELNI